MAAVLLSGTAIAFPVTAGATGFPETAHSLTTAVMIGNEVVWQDTTKVLWSDAVAAGKIVFPPQASQITSVSEFGLFVINFFDEFDQPLIPASVVTEVIIESGDLLRPMVNSFATWGDLSLEARNMVSLKDYGYASDAEKKAALINAFHSIADLQVDFTPTKSSFMPSEISVIKSTRQLTPELWLELASDQKMKLIRAQLIEANFLLSGQTPEKQRLAGLLSHSAGESAHFYRTTKPLELPVSRATALAMKGIISYVVRIAG